MREVELIHSRSACHYDAIDTPGLPAMPSRCVQHNTFTSTISVPLARVPHHADSGLLFEEYCRDCDQHGACDLDWEVLGPHGLPAVTAFLREVAAMDATQFVQRDGDRIVLTFRDIDEMKCTAPMVDVLGRTAARRGVPEGGAPSPILACSLLSPLWVVPVSRRLSPCPLQCSCLWRNVMSCTGRSSTSF